jgi:hypothetical protein
VWASPEEPARQDILNELLAFRDEFFEHFEKLFRKFDAMEAKWAERTRARRFRQHYVHCKGSLRQRS